jgi:hypothetical protein
VGNSENRLVDLEINTDRFSADHWHPSINAFRAGGALQTKNF